MITSSGRRSLIREIVHIVTLILTAPAYGVYISQLVRTGIICDEYSKFASVITSRLVKQGLNYVRHLNILVAVMHVSLFLKFGAYVRQHIWESICLPLCETSALTRNVTVRRH